MRSTSINGKVLWNGKYKDVFYFLHELASGALVEILMREKDVFQAAFYTAAILSDMSARGWKLREITTQPRDKLSETMMRLHFTKVKDEG